MTRRPHSSLLVFTALASQVFFNAAIAEEASVTSPTTPPADSRLWPDKESAPAQPVHSEAPTGPKPKIPAQAERLTPEQAAIRNEAIKLNNQGLELGQRGDYLGAIKKYDLALQKDPEVPIPYLNRALAKIYLKDLEGAIADCDKIISMGQTNLLPEALCNRGLAKVHKGDAASAVLDFDRALELKPKWTDALVNRSLAKFKSGDKKGALADLDAILVIDPNNQMAKQNRTIMASNAQAIIGQTETHVSRKEVTDTVRSTRAAAKKPAASSPSQKRLPTKK